MKKIIVYTLLAAFAWTSAVFASTWNVDPDHSSANFAIEHMAVSRVTGSFGGISGTLEFDASNTQPRSVDITIDVSSIDTGVTKRDEHLKSPDFFDVAKYPVMTFKSDKIVPKGKERYAVTGTLTLHGVSKAITVHVEGLTAQEKDPWGNIRKGAHVKAKLNRKDFGMEYNAVLESGNLLIGETADIFIDLEFIKK